MGDREFRAGDSEFRVGERVKAWCGDRWYAGTVHSFGHARNQMHPIARKVLQQRGHEVPEFTESKHTLAIFIETDEPLPSGGHMVQNTETPPYTSLLHEGEQEKHPITLYRERRAAPSQQEEELESPF